MRLLAFETATEACSVAVYDDGNVIERFEIAPRRHAELSLPWADALLAEAGLKKSQLDAIAVGRGPGAFTGVRLAIALAQGIALALDKPVVAVSTLRVLAAQAQGGCVLAAIDARMGEIYAATFAREGNDAAAISDEIVIAPSAYELPEDGGSGESGYIGLGTGFAADGNALQARFGACFASIDATALPHAADLACLAALDCAAGKFIAPELIEPAYLRNNVALTIEEQKALRGKN